MIIVKILNRLYERAKNGDDKAIVIKEAIDSIQDTMAKGMESTICTILNCHSTPVKFWVDVTLNEIRKVIKRGTDK